VYRKSVRERDKKRRVVSEPSIEKYEYCTNRIKKEGRV
jgi:hypothetical protein